MLTALYHSIIGKLFQYAKQRVRNSGYKFKKGYSRSKEIADTDGSSTSSSDERKMKRIKIDQAQREKEIVNMQSMLENVEDQIRMKHLRIEKAKSVKDYKFCDQQTAAVRELLQEKHTLESQLAAFQKKQGKAQWYQKKKSAKQEEQASPKSDSEPKRRTTSDLLTLFKKKPTVIDPDECSSTSIPLEQQLNEECHFDKGDVIGGVEDEYVDGNSSGGDTVILSPQSSPNF